MQAQGSPKKMQKGLLMSCSNGLSSPLYLPWILAPHPRSLSRFWGMCSFNILNSPQISLPSLIGFWTILDCAQASFLESSGNHKGAWN